MSKVLIFGISGFVGKYLTLEFVNCGYSVYGSDKVNSGIPDEIPFVEANLLDGVQVEKVISDIGPDMIVNLAAISSVSASWDIPQVTMSVNVIGALNILEAARKQNRKPRVMFIGSSEEYADSEKPINEETKLNANNPYGISKMAQERFATVYRERYNMAVYCVRPFNHTGIGQKDSFVLPSFCKQVADIEIGGKPGIIKVGNLSAIRDFSNVKDIVRAYRMIIESNDCKEIYNVGYGKAYSLNEILSYIVSLSSQKIEIEIDSSRVRPVDTPLICCDNKKIKSKLGWSPQYSIFDTLKEMFENYVMDGKKSEKNNCIK